jgi:hypothetical protein
MLENLGWFYVIIAVVILIAHIIVNLEFLKQCMFLHRDTAVMEFGLEDWESPIYITLTSIGCLLAFITIFVIRSIFWPINLVLGQKHFITKT